jgi:GntR family transcriptional regulator/MocR family aminotransferase
MELSILIEGREGLADQVYRGIRGAIVDGRIGVNERLPASRDLGRQLRVSRNTVLAAYERLISEGYLRGQVGAGTYVNQHFPAGKRARSKTQSTVPRLSTFGRRLSAPKAIVPRRNLPFDFRPGIPDLTHFPITAWRRISARQSRTLSASNAYYGDAAGDPQLRNAIANHFSRSRALNCTPDDVIVVSGSQQALDIIARLLIEPGDMVAIENPTYPAALATFKAAGARIVPVPVDSEGICTDRLPAKAKLIYVTPSHQFPLGVPMSLRRRRALLDWAERNQVVIVEDDYDSEFRYGGRPLDALQGLDKCESVIYLGTFSKMLFPSLRMGFVIVPPNLHRVFLSAKWMTDRHTESNEQRVIADFIREGYLSRYIRRMQRIYADRQTVLLQSLEQQLPIVKPLPAMAGLHLAGFLPSDIAADELIARSAATGVGLYSIAPFYVTRPRSGLMFGFGFCDAKDIAEGVARVSNVYKAMTRSGSLNLGL